MSRRRRVDPADLVEGLCIALTFLLALVLAFWGGLVL